MKEKLSSALSEAFHSNAALDLRPRTANKNKKQRLMAPPSRVSKPYPQASALRLCSPPLRFVLSASLQGWAIPLGLTLATPDLAGQAGVALRNPNSISERNKPI